MTLIDTDATRALRTALAQQLVEQGDIQSDVWHRVVRTVPRHPFVPTFYRQAGTVWEQVTPCDAGYLDHVYGDRALTTQVIDGVPTSSSSQPGLMLQMLEALDVADDHTVCEVGTGTGYNAALLSERATSARVTTVEVDTGLADAARERLALCGYTPSVVAGDGRRPHSENGPYDRLIATCGFSAVPYGWVRLMRPGGVIVCPVGWGNVRLTVTADGRAEGPFLPGGSCFMSVRDKGADGRVPYPGTPSSAHQKAATLDLSVLQEEGFRFLLSLVLHDVADASECDAHGHPNGHRMWARDGSWAHVTEGKVKQYGPTRLWDRVEAAYAWYDSAGRPNRDRFGVTVAPEGQSLWLDTPEASVSVTSQ
ncbi:methyltransferase domain-containing protein [Streptomyces mobaraensis]|uniref:methyltransferase domain-containing protein n=1 Tax=Streptomyces mobaraensis TaxID=35621 RepID=UPI0013E0270C|nr:methyltransferase domain-containing protein [Streptomyces mobaraensis]